MNKAVETYIANKKTEGQDSEPKLVYNPIPVIEFIKEKADPAPFIADKMIPKGCLTAIVGPTGCGKSLFTLYLVDCISRGASVFNEYKVLPKKVLLFDLEMLKEDCLERCQNICTDMTNIHIQHSKPWKVEYEESMQFLRDYVRAHGIEVVVFDTLSKVHMKNENSNSDMTQVMEDLLNLCRELDITIILLHHYNKNSEAQGISKGRGASSIVDNVASYLAIESQKITDEHGENILSMCITQEKSRRRSNLGSIGTNIYYNEQQNKTFFEYVGVVDKDRNSIESAKSAILDTVRANPGINKTKLSEQLKTVTQRIATKALAILLATGEIEEFSKSGAKNLFIKDFNIPQENNINVNEVPI